MGNTRAEMELGRKITEARREQTERAREAYARRQQEERDAQEARDEEIRRLGQGYEIPPEPAAQAPVADVKPLPPPSEEEIAEAVKRRSSRVKA